MIPVNLEVLDSINLLYLTCNPTSPYGYSFDSEKFCKLLKTSIDIDVLDVVGGEL
jgi:bifunctional pyridoxal-dependent enzyme with beta-cystathionase and maltose regulon repressor activities